MGQSVERFASKVGCLTLMLVFVSCSQLKREVEVTPAPPEASGGTGGGEPTTPAPSIPSDPGPSLSCNSSVIDSGQKGSVVTVARGTYSDIKIIPGTSIAATAFADGSALVVKLAYQDPASGNLVTEIISGDGAGAFVRLAFFSNGTPIVFWTMGAYLKVAVRSAALGSSGTWSAGVIDSGVAPRAVEVSINPIDQVGVTFLTDNAVTGRAKFLYCDAPCTSPTGFQAMTSNPYIENTNIVVGEVATGAGWCKAGANSYYPVASYSVTGNVKYAICSNSTLANCVNGANWNTQSVVATANLASKVYLDSATTSDVPKIVTLGAAGITPYRMGTTACTSPLTAFSAGTTMGAATLGNQWLTLLRDAVGKFHLIANASTTSVSYYNSTSTDIISTWNAVGTVDTVTLPTPMGGGAALDTTASSISVSYGINATPYDIKISRINDYTQVSSVAVATVTKKALDGSGDLQLTALGAQLKQVAVASTSLGKPAVAYVDFSVGAAGGARLKYAYRDGDSTVPWEISVLSNTINPQFPGLAFDSGNRPWISYFDASRVKFFLATNTAIDGSGLWTTYEFPLTPAGGPVALPAANNTAVGMYRHDGITDPVMLVVDTNAGSKGVKVAVLDWQKLAWRTPVTIDSLSGGSAGAAHVSIDSDASGNIVVAYQEFNLGRVRYSYSAGGVTWSSPVSISSLNDGAGTFIKINPATGAPAISYFDSSNSVYLAQCTGTPASCATSGWTPSVVDAASGMSGVTSVAKQSLSTSLGFASSGKAYVFYPRGQGNDGNLTVSTNWSGPFSQSAVALGANANLLGSLPINFAVSGWNVGVAPNNAGSFSGAYVGPGNWLYSLSCGD